MKKLLLITSMLIQFGAVQSQNELPIQSTYFDTDQYGREYDTKITRERYKTNANGQIDGIYVLYYRDGKTIHKRLTYKNGIIEGPAYIFQKNPGDGKLFSKEINFIDVGGIYEGQYKNGLKTGKWIISKNMTQIRLDDYILSRTAKFEVNFSNNMLNGPYKELDAEGGEVCSGNYLDNKKNDDWIETEFDFANPEMIGKSNLPIVRMTGKYEGGKRIGEWINLGQLYHYDNCSSAKSGKKFTGVEGFAFSYSYSTVWLKLNLCSANTTAMNSSYLNILGPKYGSLSIFDKNGNFISESNLALKNWEDKLLLNKNADSLAFNAKFDEYKIKYLSIVDAANVYNFNLTTELLEEFKKIQPFSIGTFKLSQGDINSNISKLEKHIQLMNQEINIRSEKISTIEAPMIGDWQYNAELVYPNSKLVMTGKIYFIDSLRTLMIRVESKYYENNKLIGEQTNILKGFFSFSTSKNLLYFFWKENSILQSTLDKEKSNELKNLLEKLNSTFSIKKVNKKNLVLENNKQNVILKGVKL